MAGFAMTAFVDHARDDAGEVEQRLPSPVTPPSRAYATERFTDLLLAVIDAAIDVKTVEMWSRAVGLSESALCGRCHCLGVRAKDALNLARMVRALHYASSTGSLVCNIIDACDERTLNRLLNRSGVDSTLFQSHIVTTMLRNQTFIPNLDPALFSSLLDALKRRDIK